MMETVATLAGAMGIAWASGINLYATVAVLGMLGLTGNIELPPSLEVLTNEGVIAAAVVMYAVEFFADKTPVVDTGWDLAHTFIRIPAGAILAAGAVGPVSQEAQLIALLLGGGLAASSHLVKTGARAAVNTSPEPFTNWTLSVAEDVAAVTALWAAFNHPYLMAAFVAAFLLFAAWFLPRVWRLIRGAMARLARWIKGGRTAPALPPSV